MTIKEFEKKINETIIELKLHEKNLTKTVMDFAMEDAIKDIIDEEKYVMHWGNSFYEENKNKLYISPKYRYTDWRNDFIEIQIHKKKNYTNWEGAHWSIMKVTAKKYGEKELTFEEAYNNYKQKIDTILEEREKKKEQEKILLEKQENEKLIKFNKAKQKILTYLEHNNLDVNEFKEIVKDFNLYDYSYIKSEYHFIFDE